MSTLVVCVAVIASLYFVIRLAARFYFPPETK
jgi:hypothetical protein